MKAVLMSIQPKWCELIASGKKTVEVRKTKPKLEVPFKVYIYCTKDGKNLIKGDISTTIDFVAVNGGKVIGEFVCDRIDTVARIRTPCMDYTTVNDKWDTHFCEISCLNGDELGKYLGFNKDGYGWHISNLVIYDKPRELGEFTTVDNEAVQNCNHRVQSYYDGFCNSGYLKCGFYCKVKDDWCDKCKTKPITRPPQSWCYVERSESNG